MRLKTKTKDQIKKQLLIIRWLKKKNKKKKLIEKNVNNDMEWTL